MTLLNRNIAHKLYTKTGYFCVMEMCKWHVASVRYCFIVEIIVISIINHSTIIMLLYNKLANKHPESTFHICNDTNNQLNNEPTEYLEEDSLNHIPEHASQRSRRQHRRFPQKRTWPSHDMENSRACR